MPNSQFSQTMPNGLGGLTRGKIQQHSVPSKDSGFISSKGDERRLHDADKVPKISTKEIFIDTGPEELFLIGEKQGKKIGKETICTNFEKRSKNIIIIPENVEDVTISFIEGMISALPKGISRKEFYKYFDIKGNDNIIDKFREIIMLDR